MMTPKFESCSVKWIRNFFCIYLSAAMVLTQVMPYGLAQQWNPDDGLLGGGGDNQPAKDPNQDPDSGKDNPQGDGSGDNWGLGGGSPLGDPTKDPSGEQAVPPPLQFVAEYGQVIVDGVEDDGSVYGHTVDVVDGVEVTTAIFYETVNSETGAFEYLSVMGLDASGDQKEMLFVDLTGVTEWDGGSIKAGEVVTDCYYAEGTLAQTMVSVYEYNETLQTSIPKQMFVIDYTADGRVFRTDYTWTQVEKLCADGSVCDGELVARKYEMQNDPVTGDIIGAVLTKELVYRYQDSVQLTILEVDMDLDGNVTRFVEYNWTDIELDEKGNFTDGILHATVYSDTARTRRVKEIVWTYVDRKQVSAEEVNYSEDGTYVSEPVPSDEIAVDNPRNNAVKRIVEIKKLVRGSKLSLHQKIVFVVQNLIAQGIVDPGLDLNADKLLDEKDLEILKSINDLPQAEFERVFLSLLSSEHLLGYDLSSDGVSNFGDYRILVDGLSNGRPVPELSDPETIRRILDLAKASGYLDVDRDGRSGALSDGILIIRYLCGVRGAELVKGVFLVEPTAEVLAALEMFLANAQAQGAYDVNGDGDSSSFIDGLTILKYLFEVTGEALYGQRRENPGQIEGFLDLVKRSGLLDLDGNGLADALTDGILLCRYLMGYRGDQLTVAAVDLTAGTRLNAADIVVFIEEALKRGAYDVNNDGDVSDAVDGRTILRYLLGYTGDALYGQRRVQDVVDKNADSRISVREVVQALSEFAKALYTQRGGIGYAPSYDFNGDDQINHFDLALLIPVLESKAENRKIKNLYVEAAGDDLILSDQEFFNLRRALEATKGKALGQEGYDARFDLNGNNRIDEDDVLRVREAFLMSPAPDAAFNNLLISQVGRTSTVEGVAYLNDVVEVMIEGSSVSERITGATTRIPAYSYFGPGNRWLSQNGGVEIGVPDGQPSVFVETQLVSPNPAYPDRFEIVIRNTLAGKQVKISYTYTAVPGHENQYDTNMLGTINITGVIDKSGTQTDLVGKTPQEIADAVNNAVGALIADMLPVPPPLTPAEIRAVLFEVIADHPVNSIDAQTEEGMRLLSYFDLNGDGLVDGTDMAFIRDWETTGTAEAQAKLLSAVADKVDERFDVNKDGRVDEIDEAMIREALPVPAIVVTHVIDLGWGQTVPIQVYDDGHYKLTLEYREYTSDANGNITLIIYPVGAVKAVLHLDFDASAGYALTGMSIQNWNSITGAMVGPKNVAKFVKQGGNYLISHIEREASSSGLATTVDFDYDAGILTESTVAYTAAGEPVNTTVAKIMNRRNANFVFSFGGEPLIWYYPAYPDTKDFVEVKSVDGVTTAIKEWLWTQSSGTYMYNGVLQIGDLDFTVADIVASARTDAALRQLLRDDKLVLARQDIPIPSDIDPATKVAKIQTFYPNDLNGIRIDVTTQTGASSWLTRSFMTSTTPEGEVRVVLKFEGNSKKEYKVLIDDAGLIRLEPVPADVDTRILQAVAAYLRIPVTDITSIALEEFGREQSNCKGPGCDVTLSYLQVSTKENGIEKYYVGAVADDVVAEPMMYLILTDSHITGRALKAISDAVGVPIDPRVMDMRIGQLVFKLHTDEMYCQGTGCPMWIGDLKLTVMTNDRMSPVHYYEGTLAKIFTLKDAPAGQDSDSDGVDDRTEIQLGTNPMDSMDRPNAELTGPSVDTDADGFSDSLEIAFGSNPVDSVSIPSLDEFRVELKEVDSPAARVMKAMVREALILDFGLLPSQVDRFEIVVNEKEKTVMVRTNAIKQQDLLTGSSQLFSLLEAPVNLSGLDIVFKLEDGPQMGMACTFNPATGESVCPPPVFNLAASTFKVGDLTYELSYIAPGDMKPPASDNRLHVVRVIQNANPPCEPGTPCIQSEPTVGRELTFHYPEDYAQSGVFGVSIQNYPSAQGGVMTEVLITTRQEGREGKMTISEVIESQVRSLGVVVIANYKFIYAPEGKLMGLRRESFEGLVLEVTEFGRQVDPVPFVYSALVRFPASSDLVPVTFSDWQELFDKLKDLARPALGDVNRDGVMNEDDVVLIEKFLAGEITLDEAQMILADTDRNRKVDEWDAVNIREVLAGRQPRLVGIGDLDRSGVLSAADAFKAVQIALRLIPFTQFEWHLADANEDGRVTRLDSFLIVNAGLGLIGSLPAAILAGDVDRDGKLSEADAARIEQNVGKQVTSLEIALSDTDEDGQVTTWDVFNVREVLAGRQPKLVFIGDVNLDHSLDAIDITTVGRWLANMVTFTPFQKHLADVNKDGRLTPLDRELIALATVQAIALPSAIKVGDMDGDGALTEADAIIIEKHLSGEVPFDPGFVGRYLHNPNVGSDGFPFNLADTDGDGKVTIYDAMNIREVLAGRQTKLIGIGDLDRSGILSAADAFWAVQIAMGLRQPTEFEWHLADANQDGRVTRVDSFLIVKAGLDLLNHLPASIYAGDVDQDGKLTAADAALIERNVGKDITTLELALSDTDEDGKVTLWDLENIRRVLDGKQDRLALLGDLTGNKGQITGSDVTMIMRYLINMRIMDDFHRHLADVNQDGRVTWLDRVLLQMRVVGSIVLPSAVKLGDADSDGVLTAADADRIERFLKGEIQLGEFEKSRMDTDGDGKVTIYDAINIRELLAGKQSKLVAIGDLDRSGKLSAADAFWATQIALGLRPYTDFEFHLADANQDGKVTKLDAFLIVRTGLGFFNQLPAQVLVGDLDQNGVLDQADVSLLQQYLAGQIKLDDYQQALADVDLDNKVTAWDLFSLNMILQGHKDVTREVVMKAVDARLASIFGEGVLHFDQVNGPQNFDGGIWVMEGIIADANDNEVSKYASIEFRIDENGQVVFTNDIFDRLQVPAEDRVALEAQLAMTPEAPIGLSFAIVQNPQGMGIGGEVVWQHLYRFIAEKEGTITLYYYQSVQEPGRGVFLGDKLAGDSNYHTITFQVSSKPLPDGVVLPEGTVHLVIGESYDIPLERGGAGVEVARHEYRWLSPKEIEDMKIETRVRSLVLGNLTQMYGYAADEVKQWAETGLLKIELDVKNNLAFVHFDPSLVGQVRTGGRVNPLGTFVTPEKIEFVYKESPVVTNLPVPRTEVVLVSSLIAYPEGVIFEGDGMHAITVGLIKVEYSNERNYRKSHISIYDVDKGIRCIQAPCPGSGELVKEIENVSFSPCWGDMCMRSMPWDSAAIYYRNRTEGIVLRKVDYNVWQDRYAHYGSIYAIYEYDAAGNQVVVNQLFYGAWKDGAALTCADKGGCTPEDGLIVIVRTDAQGETISKVEIYGTTAVVKLPDGTIEKFEYQHLEELLDHVRVIEENNNRWLKWLNDPAFNFDFNQDAKLDDNDYAEFKMIVAKHPDLWDHLTEDARKKLDLNGDATIDPKDVVLFGEKLRLLEAVNNPEFNFDFDQDGRLTVEDYSLFKQFDGIDGDILPPFLTPEARMKLDLNRDGMISPEDVILFGERLKLLDWVNDPAFNFDFDQDGKLTVEDYSLFKQFDGIDGDILPPFLTEEAKKKLDLNKDGVVDPNDVLLFGEWLKLIPIAERLAEAIKHAAVGSAEGVDINGDGRFDAADIERAKIIIDFLNSGITEEMILRADINGDGVDDEKDAALMKEARYRTPDVNKDGRVDYADLDLLVKAIENANIRYVSDGDRIAVNGVMYTIARNPEGLWIFTNGDEQIISSPEGLIVLGGVEYRLSVMEIDGSNGSSQKLVLRPSIADYALDLNDDGLFNALDYVQMRQWLAALIDFTGDGIVDDADYEMLYRIIRIADLRITPEEIAKADVNQDGKVDATDVNILMDALVSGIFTGDLNGDGIVDDNDLDMAVEGYRAAFEVLNLLSPEVLMTLDYNKDGAVNQADLDKLYDDIKSKIADTMAKVRLAEELARGIEAGGVDLNGDGIVDEKDLDLAVKGYRAAFEVLNLLSPEVLMTLDYNKDGAVNQADLDKLYDDIKSKIADTMAKVRLAEELARGIEAGGVDLNGDGIVDEKDLDLAVKGYRAAFEVLNLLSPEVLMTLDYNKDGAVNQADLDKLYDDIKSKIADTMAKVRLVVDFANVLKSGSLDFDGNNAVNQADSDIAIRRYEVAFELMNLLPPDVLPVLDVNGDGVVGKADLELVLEKIQAAMVPPVDNRATIELLKQLKEVARYVDSDPAAGKYYLDALAGGTIVFKMVNDPCPPNPGGVSCMAVATLYEVKVHLTFVDGPVNYFVMPEIDLTQMRDDVIELKVGSNGLQFALSLPPSPHYRLTGVLEIKDDVPNVLEIERAKALVVVDAALADVKVRISGFADKINVEQKRIEQSIQVFNEEYSALKAKFDQVFATVSSVLVEEVGVEPWMSQSLKDAVSKFLDEANELQAKNPDGMAQDYRQAISSSKLLHMLKIEQQSYVDYETKLIDHKTKVLAAPTVEELRSLRMPVYDPPVFPAYEIALPVDPRELLKPLIEEGLKLAEQIEAERPVIIVNMQFGSGQLVVENKMGQVTAKILGADPTSPIEFVLADPNYQPVYDALGNLVIVTLDGRKITFDGKNASYSVAEKVDSEDAPAGEKLAKQTTLKMINGRMEVVSDIIRKSENGSIMQAMTRRFTSGGTLSNEFFTRIDDSKNYVTYSKNYATGRAFLSSSRLLRGPNGSTFRSVRSGAVVSMQPFVTELSSGLVRNVEATIKTVGGVSAFNASFTAGTPLMLSSCPPSWGILFCQG